MQLTFWQILALFMAGLVPAILALVGVCLGAYFVLITKKENVADAIQNPFSRPQGGAYIAKGEEIDDFVDPDSPEGVDATAEVDKMTQRFLKQTGLGG